MHRRNIIIDKALTRNESSKEPVISFMIPAPNGPMTAEKPYDKNTTG